MSVKTKFFGEMVRERRKERGLSIEALAELCGVTDRCISDIERGVSVPRLDTVLKICKHCGVDCGELGEVKA